MILNNQWITEEIKEEIKKYLEANDNKDMGCSKSHSKRKVYSNTSPPQETRKNSNKQPNFTSKTTTEREEQTRPKVSRRKEIKGKSRNKWNRKDQ